MISIFEVISQSESLEAKGDISGAIEIYQHWLETTDATEKWGAYFNLGALLHKIGDLSDAKEAFKKALVGKPDLIQAVRAIDEILKIESLNINLPTKKENIFFTVVVPTHKRANLLARALASVTQQMVSVPFEVIVISDAIDFETDSICNKFLKSTDTYIRRSGKNGPSESRNIGLLLAKGKYILFLDDDDAWHPNLLSQLLACPAVIEGLPVYFNCSVVKESRLPSGPVLLEENFLDLMDFLTPDVYVKNQVHMSCLALPRTLINDIKFDTHMRAYEDWDFQLAVYSRNFPVHVPILGSRIFEVHDSTTDRRGQSKAAHDFNAVMDYLYVYRRHPAPVEGLKIKRANFLKNIGLDIPLEMF